MVKVKCRLFAVFLFIFSSCYTNPKKYYEQEVKQVLINGLVIKKYLDSNDHMYPTIKLKDTSGILDYSPIRFYKLYEIVKIGDSISKPKGSLEYRVFRKDTIIKIYPVIDGDIR